MRSALRLWLVLGLFGACARVAETPELGKSALRVGQLWPIKELNPVLHLEGFGAEGHYLVFDRLVGPGPDGTPRGGLLEKWQASEGGRRFLLTLRPKIRFHDGQPMTSDDVIFTLAAIRDPRNESNYASDFDAVESVEKVDDRTVAIRMRRPFWHFPELLEFGVLPLHLLREKRLADPEFNRHPVGAGPFRVAKLESGLLELERNEDYYGEPAGLDRITVASYESDQLWRRLLAHHIEVALLLPWSKHRFVSHLGTIRTDEGGRQLALAICFNRSRKPFDGAEARRAFAAGIDRQRLVERTEFGFAKVTERLDPNEPPSAPLDVEKARHELGGRTLHIGVVATDSDGLDVAMELQRQLSAADVTLQIDLDAATDTSDMRFCSLADPRPLESAAYKYGTQLNPAYRDIDAIFDRIAETEDDQARRALFQKVEDRILEDAPLMILFWQPTFSAYRAEYCGYHMINIFDGLEKMRRCP